MGAKTRARLTQETCSVGSSGFTEEVDTDDDTKIVKSRVSGFSRGKLEAGRNELGLCTTKYECCFWCSFN